ncbi:MAG: outer membrane beta-barrel domain-containing protein [Gammaproteobacteria bacterium]|nr:outer membrane beta-barrel domain-containing protein [Gammaproteobacteria bacterium]
MESGFRILFLIALFGVSGLAIAADDKAVQDDKSLNQIIQQEPIIQPEVKRRKITDADIGSDNFEVNAFVGLLSIEDFGTGAVYGARLDYHITEDFFVEGSIGQSKAGTTSYERLSGGVSLLTDSQRTYRYYDIAIGYNVLPGEAFLGRNHAYNTALYLVAGAGGTEFAGDTRFTITVGGGYRINFADWIGMHLDFRDHIFSSDVTGESKDTHNFETTLSITYVF